jgi:hypothetical protein
MVYCRHGRRLGNDGGKQEGGGLYVVKGALWSEITHALLIISKGTSGVLATLSVHL